MLDPGVVSDDCRIRIRNSCPSGLGEWWHTTPGCDLAPEEGDCLATRGATEQLGNYYVPMFGRPRC